MRNRYACGWETSRLHRRNWSQIPDPLDSPVISVAADTVHASVVPLTLLGLVRATEDMPAAEQTLCDAELTCAVGMGLTVTTC